MAGVNYLISNVCGLKYYLFENLNIMNILWLFVIILIFFILFLLFCSLFMEFEKVEEVIENIEEELIVGLVEDVLIVEE